MIDALQYQKDPNLDAKINQLLSSIQANKCTSSDNH